MQGLRSHLLILMGLSGLFNLASGGFLAASPLFQSVQVKRTQRSFRQGPVQLLSVTWQPGWEGSEGEWVPVFVWLSPFAVRPNLPQHCFLFLFLFKKNQCGCARS